MSVQILWGHGACYLPNQSIIEHPEYLERGQDDLFTLAHDFGLGL